MLQRLYESCYATEWTDKQAHIHSDLAWHAPGYKPGCSNKKSVSTASIFNVCSHLPSVLHHAQMPAIIVISQSTNSPAAYTRHHRRVDSLRTVPQSPNVGADDLALVSHESLTFCKMPFFIVLGLYKAQNVSCQTNCMSIIKPTNSSDLAASVLSSSH